MNLTIQQQQTIIKLHPNVVLVRGDVATDVNGNVITYDLSAVEARMAQDEADKTAQEQAQVTAKASALAKLTALGLTQDEVKSLSG
jgi:hypothetical protein